MQNLHNPATSSCTAAGRFMSYIPTSVSFMQLVLLVLKDRHRLSHLGAHLIWGHSWGGNKQARTVYGAWLQSHRHLLARCTYGHTSHGTKAMIKLELEGWLPLTCVCWETGTCRAPRHSSHQCPWQAASNVGECAPCLRGLAARQQHALGAEVRDGTCWPFDAD